MDTHRILSAKKSSNATTFPQKLKTIEQFSNVLGFTNSDTVTLVTLYSDYTTKKAVSTIKNCITTPHLVDASVAGEDTVVGVVACLSNGRNTLRAFVFNQVGDLTPDFSADIQVDATISRVQIANISGTEYLLVAHDDINRVATLYSATVSADGAKHTIAFTHLQTINHGNLYPSNFSVLLHPL